MVYRLNIMLLVVLIIPACSFGEEIADHLVINEIYFDAEQKGESWIEIYNPTPDTLFLAAMWAEGIRGSNILVSPGAGVPPKGYLIVCPMRYARSSYLEETQQSLAQAIERFRQKWNIPQRVDIVPGAVYHDWGLMSIWGVADRKYLTKGTDGHYLWGTHGVRDEIWVAPRSDDDPNADPLQWTGEGLIAMSEGTWIYSRIQEGLDTNNSTDFVYTAPTPGRSNNVASEVLLNTWGEIKNR